MDSAIRRADTQTGGVSLLSSISEFHGTDSGKTRAHEARNNRFFNTSKSPLVLHSRASSFSITVTGCICSICVDNFLTSGFFLTWIRVQVRHCLCDAAMSSIPSSLPLVGVKKESQKRKRGSSRNVKWRTFGVAQAHVSTMGRGKEKKKVIGSREIFLKGTGCCRAR